MVSCTTPLTRPRQTLNDPPPLTLSSPGKYQGAATFPSACRHHLCTPLFVLLF